MARGVQAIATSSWRKLQIPFYRTDKAGLWVSFITWQFILTSPFREHMGICSWCGGRYVYRASLGPELASYLLWVLRQGIQYPLIFPLKYKMEGVNNIHPSSSGPVFKISPRLGTVALRKEKRWDLCGPWSRELQASQSYRMKPCLRKKKWQKEQKSEQALVWINLLGII